MNQADRKGPEDIVRAVSANYAGFRCPATTERGKLVGPSAKHASEIQDAEKDQHQSHRKLHPKADSGRNREAEQDDGGTDHEDRERMPHAPTTRRSWLPGRSNAPGWLSWRRQSRGRD